MTTYCAGYDPDWVSPFAIAEEFGGRISEEAILFDGEEPEGSEKLNRLMRVILMAKIHRQVGIGISSIPIPIPDEERWHREDGDQAERIIWVRGGLSAAGVQA